MSLLRTTRVLRFGAAILPVLALSPASVLPHTLIHTKQNENESWLVIAGGDILFIAVQRGVPDISPESEVSGLSSNAMIYGDFGSTMRSVS